jgi:multidrug efflux pump subunit AcrB
MLTTLTTVLGLLTLALKDELWGSLAVAFIWGLLLGTFIILVYIPAMIKWGLVRKNSK